MYGSFIADNPFRTGVAGTIKNDGASLRTVVLRHTDPDEKQVIFYTDSRSAKVDELRAAPQISWLFYDPIEKIQVKLGGNAIIHHQDNVARDYWSKVNARGRMAYMAIPAPSVSVSDPVNGLEYLDDDSDTEAGYQNFAVIITQVNFIEWLILRDNGHRRAQFRLIDESWKGQWLIP